MSIFHSTGKVYLEEGEREAAPAAWVPLLSWAEEASQCGEQISSPVVGKLCFDNGVTDSA